MCYRVKSRYPHTLRGNIPILGTQGWIFDGTRRNGCSCLRALIDAEVGSIGQLRAQRDASVKQRITDWVVLAVFSLLFSAAVRLLRLWRRA